MAKRNETNLRLDSDAPKTARQARVRRITNQL